MRTIHILALAAVITGLLAGAARAGDAKVTGALDLPVLSGYAWRGQVLNTEAVVQPIFFFYK